jgi:predicted metal-dependent phosphoesterase TrpH
MRCDLHVHTWHSGMCTLPALRRVCRESYTDPLALYEHLKRAGMDLVTVTDHDSIDAAEALRSRPDFFLSEEVTCRMPSGTELHVGVYDILERDHTELQRRRDDFESFTCYLRSRGLFFTANHIFSSLTGQRAAADFDLFESAFPGIETRNGHMLAIANAHASHLADFGGCAEAGGSDAHVLASAARAWTVVPRTRDKQEYLDGLRAGRGRVRGATGSYGILTRDVLSISLAMVRENPWTAVLAPLALAVPAAIAANYLLENVFARYWMARYLRTRRRRGICPVAEVAA